MSICYFIYFPFWFCGHNFGSDCASSWSLFTFYFVPQNTVAKSDGFNGDIFVIIMIPIALDTLHCLVHETCGSR